MKKSEFQFLAQAKLEDAVVLLNGGRSSNAYYLAGYAVEFALKACISTQFSADDIPDAKLVRDVYTHDLVKLVALAGLKQHLDRELSADDDFAANWAIVKDWSEASRYQSISIGDAEFLISAINHPNKGVLPWIKQYW